MTHNIRVKCILDRYWNPSEHHREGEIEEGVLVGFSTQTADDGSGKVIPVGIVMMEDDSFQSVPMEFIFSEAWSNQP